MLGETKPVRKKKKYIYIYTHTHTHVHTYTHTGRERLILKAEKSHILFSLGLQESQWYSAVQVGMSEDQRS